MDDSIPDIIWEIDTKPVITSKEKNNSWARAPPMVATLSIRTLISLQVRVVKKNDTRNECLVPLFQYTNLEGLPTSFEEPFVNDSGAQIGVLKGRVRLSNMPFLTQMPR